jgi:hypothetical protein
LSKKLNVGETTFLGLIRVSRLISLESFKNKLSHQKNLQKEHELTKEQKLIPVITLIFFSSKFVNTETHESGRHK